nr:hypoxia up-regulated 1 [Cryptococcus depauperatus CBS 7855]
MRLKHVLALSLVLFAPTIQAAVLAIDYGAEFTKLSLVKPGTPFDVVLDKDSKRKIASVVGWKRDERVFGAEAKMAATRFPDTHYPYVKQLLGSSSPTRLPLYPTPPKFINDTLIFPHPSPPSYISPAISSDEAWTPTALLAHQLSYFRHLAESIQPPGQRKEPIYQVVVTVPGWWDHAQRRAYRDALELQGMSCLAMISEGVGVALNYAMTRTFPTLDSATGQGEKEFHIVYDSGALATTATVLAFYQTSNYPTPKSKTAINTTHIEVLGTGWEQAGGVLLDTVLQQILLEDFIKKSGKEGARNDKKTLAKLAKEASRVKHILSANQEANVAIESLYDDVDYRSHVSRAALDNALDQAGQLFSSPINSALLSAGLSLQDISSVILFGGNTRVPLVQTALKTVLGGEDKIAQNVNSDEAAVLGAAFYGAALSKQFRVKPIEIKERSVGDISIVDKGVVFPQGTILGERKTFTFPAKGDINLEFIQTIDQPASAHSSLYPQPILSVQVYDVEKALNEFTASEPVVNLTLRLDPKGHLSAANAVLVSNVTEFKEGGVAGVIKGLFGSKDEADKGEQDKEEQDGTSRSKAKDQKMALKFREKHLGIKSMSGEEKRITNARYVLDCISKLSTDVTRLQSIATFEITKAVREEARNSLESYLYALSTSLGDEKSALKDFSTPTEQNKLQILMEETFDWLADNAEIANEEALRAKFEALKNVERPGVYRYNEYKSRDKSVTNFRQAMHLARLFYVDAIKNYTLAMEAAATATPEDPATPPKYTEEELKEVNDLLKDYTLWIDEKMTEQVKLDNDRTKDPVITVKELEERGRKLQTTVLRLQNRKAPRKPKPSPSLPSSSTSPLAKETVTLASQSVNDIPELTESQTQSSTTLASPTDHGPESTVEEKKKKDIIHEEL